MQQNVTFAEKKIIKIFAKDKNYRKLRDHCYFTSKYRSATHVPNEIPAVFHNGLSYDYHFIIKELARSFEVHFECLGENTKKYKAFWVPIEKEISW